MPQFLQPLSKHSPVPLHLQLLFQLRQLIIDGVWPPHQRLPSEPELVEQLSVSRATVRQALDAAEREGLIYRVVGKGTFVEARPAAAPAGTVGFVIPHCNSAFDSRLLAGVESVVKARGYQVIFCHSEQQLEEENRCLADLARRRVDGVVIWPVQTDQPQRELYHMAARQIPLVQIDRTLAQLPADSALADNAGGSAAAIRHLIGLGHRRIAFLARPCLHLQSVAERLAAYQRGMADAGLQPLAPILVGTPSEPDTPSTLRDFHAGAGVDIDALRPILAGPERPSAIVAMNDLLALSAYRAAQLAGLQVPDDLSIVGFDDLEIFHELRIALTTVAQSPYTLGAEGARLLLERLDGYRGPPRMRRIPTQLVVRESCAPPARPTDPPV